MSFEGLKTEILSQAKQEADKIAADLQTRTKSEESRILGRAQATEEEIIQDAEQEGAKQSRRMLQEADLAGKAAILKAKEEELKKTEEMLVQEFIDQDAEKTISALMALVPEEGGTITAGEKHLEQVKKAARGRKVLGETIQNEGGFIFRGDSIEINFTISHLVASLFRKNRSRIASTLFG